MTMQRFVIDGINPVPWKAPEAQHRSAKGGRKWVQFFKDQDLSVYQEAIKGWFEEVEALPAVGEDGKPILHKGPFTLRFYFFREGATADATNLQKALEDALEGVLYKNDRDDIDVHSRTYPVAKGSPPLIIVEYTPHEGLDFDGADEMAQMYQRYARDVVVNDQVNRRPRRPSLG